MLVVLGVVLGLVLGLSLACIWGLRRARRDKAVLLLLGFVLVPVYFTAAEALGWPTPGSVARSAGLVSEPSDGTVLAAVIAVVAALTAVVFVRAGASRRLELWAAEGR